jgi:archaeal cell division control protein 6
MSEVQNFFENFLNQKSIFLDKKVLLSSHVPDKILYREDMIHEIANILAPSLRLEKPSNLFLYGKTGTGKTVSVKHVVSSMNFLAKQKEIPLKNVYINCKLKRVADTEYRLIAQLIKEYGSSVPATGLPTDEIYNIFYSLIDKDKHLLLLILDEVDQLTKKIGDEILYNLTRINSELKNSQIAIIGISNNLVFAENLDPRVRSSLSEEELIFPPYNAIQIQEILRSRSNQAFNENSVQPGVIEKCSAFAARDHGDARRAIDLLRVAGEVAEREGSYLLEVKHLDEAERKVESDMIINSTINQPKQFHCVLYAILLYSNQKNSFFTGEVYEIYKNVCLKSKQNVLTQRRVSDILSELDMLGIINAKIISKGRYGRMREISLAIEENLSLKLKEILEKSLHAN